MSSHDTPATRLRRARISAGYGTAKAFAEAHDIPQPTYAMHEKGRRRISAEVAERYAEELSCSAAWILTGEGNAPENQVDSIIPSPVTIAELDLRGHAGVMGPLNEDNSAVEVVDQWQLPGEFLRAQTTAAAAELRVIRIYGDSMQPVFNPGDRVLVDISDVSPSPPGLFVLWDGLGMLIKRVEFVPYSRPEVINLLSANAAYPTHTLPLSEVKIRGRVIGKWLWT